MASSMYSLAFLARLIIKSLENFDVPCELVTSKSPFDVDSDDVSIFELQDVVRADGYKNVYCPSTNELTGRIESTATLR